MDLSSARQQFDVPGVEFGMRCGFCNGLEEAEGTLGIELAPGQFGEVPIGENCLNIVKSKQHIKWVEDPNTATSEPVR